MKLKKHGEIGYKTGDLIRCIEPSEEYHLSEGEELVANAVYDLGEEGAYVGIYKNGVVTILSASRFEKVPEEEILERIKCNASSY